MTAQIIDGKALAKSLKEGYKQEVEQLKAKGVEPRLAVLMVGDDPASEVYAGQKKKNCENLGIAFEMHRLPATATEPEVLAALDKLNKNEDITAIMVEMPLPKGLDNNRVQAAICPDKDIDGANPANLGRLASGLPCLRACTPAASIACAEAAGVDFKGKRVVVLGRSVTVGKPAALMALEKHGTVTICHSRTADLPSVTREADVLIAAIGKAKFVTADMVKPGAVVIDVGINSTPDGLVGDCDTEALMNVAGAITPVPGGVGPVTNARLMGNIVASAARRLEEK